MPDPRTYDYAIVRVVPRVERGEFVNVGVIVCCAAHGFLRAAFEVDEARLRVLDPALDLGATRAALGAIDAVCAGRDEAGAIGRLSVRERFDWLVAPRSTSVQTSPAHSGRCSDLDRVVEHLLRTMVRAPAAAGDAGTGG